ncbi:MAG: fused MFS/spermidine synthase [Proteobacteria bacterium]|nr:fused MFS/spermidine synthase [Pseudomonadota bacterium]
MRRPDKHAYKDAFVIEQHNATGRISYWQRGDNQSVADRYGVSLADYIHAMYGLLRQAKCDDVLMIGCGGGTLATMLHRAGVKVTIVDIDRASFEISRRYFRLPHGIECHVCDGQIFLRRNRARYDAIVLDAYSNQSVPKHFLTNAFFKLAKSRLRARNAVFLMNLLVADDDDRKPDRIARLMRKAWRNVRLLDAEGWTDRNAIALAGAVRKLKRPRLIMPPARGAKRVATGLKALGFRMPRA